MSWKGIFPSIKGLSDPCQQISQPVSRQNHPPISNPARINNVSHRKHGSRCDHRAVLIPTSRNPDPPAVAVSDLRRNLVALLSPRLKVSVRKFGKLPSLQDLLRSNRNAGGASYYTAGVLEAHKNPVRGGIKRHGAVALNKDPKGRCRVGVDLRGDTGTNA